MVRGIHRLQLLCRLKESVGVQISSPLQMNRAGYAAAARRADELSGELVVAARIDKHRIRGMESAQNIFGRCEKVASRFHFEIARLGNCRFVGHRQAACGPGVEAAIENVDIRVPKEFQEPEEPCRPHARHDRRR